VLRVQYLRIQGRDAVLERSDVLLARTVFIFGVEGPKNQAIRHISNNQIVEIVKIVKITAVVTSNTELLFVKYSKYVLYKSPISLTLNFSAKVYGSHPAVLLTQ
jgi:hypothetical protein